MGTRETPKRVAMASSFRRVPAGIVPAMISARSSVTTEFDLATTTRGYGNRPALAPEQHGFTSPPDVRGCARP
ncbi:hypothetical protein GCM10027258_49660 [Amycolatopsis stemonae]